MPTLIAVVATDPATRTRLAALVPEDSYIVTRCPPDVLPDPLPRLFVLALPGIDTPEEQLIERLRADEATAATPIVLVSTLPMVQLQSLPYASDWTIAIVEEPVSATVLAETMSFLLENAP
jgi:CheY-like chemotaxis protein